MADNLSFPGNNAVYFLVTEGYVNITGVMPTLLESNFLLAVIYIAITSVALLIGTFGNIMILVIAGMTRRPNRVGREFMINLALADLCVSGVIDPMCIVGVIKGQRYFDTTPILCHLIATLCLTACFCAFISLSLLAFNRYIHICHNNIYHKMFGRKTCIALCAMGWIVSMLCDIPNYSGWNAHLFDGKNHQCIWQRLSPQTYMLFVAGVFSIPLTLVVMSFVLIFRKIWNTKKKLYSISTEKFHRTKRVMKESARSAKNIFVMFLVYVFCWIPYVIVIAVDIQDQLPMEVHLIVTLLAHLHSSCNFTVYFILNKRFREKFLQIWRCFNDTFIESESCTNSAYNNSKCNNVRSINPHKITSRSKLYSGSTRSSSY